MKAVILAAGIGKRLKEKGKSLPKCLIKIGDETILERQIRMIKQFGIEEISVVIGGQGECWTKENQERIKKIHNNVVINEQNIDFKRIYSLFCGFNRIQKDDTLILDGDLFFNEELIKKIIHNQSETFLVTKFIESKFSENVGSKVISNINNEVKRMGYDFPSNIVFSGILKIGAKDFQLFFYEISKKENWNESLSEIITRLSKMIKINCIQINSPQSSVKTQKIKVFEAGAPATNYIERIDGNILRKKSLSGKNKLINEVNFIQSLPNEIKEHFPRIISYEWNQEFAQYDMEYSSYPSFVDLIFNKEIEVKEALINLERILDFMFEKVYTSNTKDTPVGFIEDYFNKIKNRYSSVKGKSNVLDKMISTDYIKINNKKLKNFSMIFECLKKDIKYLASLEPSFVSTFHGDFKFDNMLIDKITKDFILIDPRGKTASNYDESDYMEDIAKLFTSCQGYYDMFKRNKYSLDVKEDKDISINYHLEEGETLNLFNELNKEILKLLPKYLLIKQDMFWEKRLLFIEAILLIANAPFHLTSKENENFAIVLLSRGIELLNELLEKYPLSENYEFILLNINTIEDYDLINNLKN